MQQGVHQQTQLSLGRAVYIYTFGDRPIQLNIGGICFSEGCRTGGGAGIDRVLKYYDRNKASNLSVNRNEIPFVSVRYGQQTYRGLLVACNVASDDTNERTSKFEMVIQVFPRILDDTGGAIGPAEDSGGDIDSGADGADNPNGPVFGKLPGSETN
jgi:hypothetical protein